MNAQQFWNIDNVSSFRNIDVRNGEIDMSESEYVDHLNECYGDVYLCGGTYGAGDLLKDADPVAFRCGKSEHESQIQSELEDQLNREDSADIDFIDGEEWELSEDDEEESDDE